MIKRKNILSDNIAEEWSLDKKLISQIREGLASFQYNLVEIVTEEIKHSTEFSEEVSSIKRYKFKYWSLG